MSLNPIQTPVYSHSYIRENIKLLILWTCVSDSDIWQRTDQSSHQRGRLKKNKINCTYQESNEIISSRRRSSQVALNLTWHGGLCLLPASFISCLVYSSTVNMETICPSKRRPLSELFDVTIHKTIVFDSGCFLIIYWKAPSNIYFEISDLNISHC